MPLLQEDFYTVDYIESLPEGRRAELIDGYVYDLACPSDTHQNIIANLTADIIYYIRSHNGKCRTRPAPYAVYLNNDEYTYVEPDISVICDPARMDEKGCHGAPDWIMEIVSPASMRMDYIIKLYKYQAAGVREYWIIDPDKKEVMVYNFENDHYQNYSFLTPVPVGIYPGFEINLGEYT